MSKYSNVGSLSDPSSFSLFQPSSGSCFSCVTKACTATLEAPRGGGSWQDRPLLLNDRVEGNGQEKLLVWLQIFMPKCGY